MSEILHMILAIDPTTFQDIPITIQAGITLVLFGGWAGLFTMTRLIIVGKLATGRELREKNARILVLEDTVKMRDEQLSEILRVVPGLADVLRKFHLAAKAELSAEEDTENMS